MNLSDAIKVCLEPVRVDNSKFSDVPNYQGCRKCKKCLNRKHTDLAGRAAAEMLVSDHTVALTLTYGKNAGERSQLLHYRDMQLMLKRLRKDGYKVRYLAAGEYGSKRGRAHWHVCLFFQGKCPPLPPVETEEQHWRYWVDAKHNFAKTNGPEPIGFVFVQKPDFHGLRYVVKYATKDDGSERTTRQVQPSLKPPLGAGYWPVIAKREVEQGLPFRFTYYLPDCRFGNGNAVEFYARDASARLKWAAYRDAWHRKHPFKAPPITDKAMPSWYKTIVPLYLRNYTVEPKNRAPLKAGPKTFARVKVFDKFALIKLHSGDLVAMQYHGKGKELSLWRVGSLKEAIALGRGQKNLPARKLRFGEVPF